MDSTWNCSLCDSFAASSLKRVIRHIGRVHCHDPAFHVHCGIESCPRTYRNFHSYKKHMYLKHREFLGISPKRPSLPAHQSNDTIDYSTEENDDDPGPSSCLIDNPPTLRQSIKRASALFIMKAKHVHKVSQSSLNYLLQDVTMEVQQKVGLLEAEVSSALASRGISMDSELLSVFQKPEILNPFDKLETEHLQKLYFDQSFGVVYPVERRLSKQIISTRKKGRPYFKRVWACAYEVPLLDSLTQLLSDSFILDEVLRGHSQQDHQLMGDYCDGTAYKTHSLFSSCPQALQIMAYYDDLEICNPLGSRAKKHKLAIFYYTLGNISPLYRSTLRCIQLLAIVKSSVLQEVGPDIVLESFMGDLKLLERESGVEFSINGTKHTFRGTLTVLPGDNLASQYLGGYKALNAALRKCRHCLAVDEDMQSMFLSDLFDPRTRETHSSHCAMLGSAMHNHYATTYGLHRDSILNESRYFHVTDGLVPDVMHDVLEGVLPFRTKELLKHLIHTKVLTLSELNDALDLFPYGKSDLPNKPSPISEKTLASSDHALKQSASQMWCLGRLLPLMIGNKIKEDDPYWLHYLLLLTILDFVLAPVTSRDVAAYLRTLIDEYLHGFKQLYPQCRIIPKMHYLVHYPDMMERFGPLVRCWCMRFESKHSYFKDLAHRVKCFKNIAKTMAERHQHLVAYYNNCSPGKSPYCKETDTGVASDLALNSLPYMDLVISFFPDLSEDSQVTRLSWFRVNGTVYSSGSVVVLKNELLPEFGVIVDIIVFGVDIYYIVYKKLVTECFEQHFHSFKVFNPSSMQYGICKNTELLDHHILHNYNISSNSYVSLKYHLMENIV